jgi:hypothetical protein
VLRSTRLFARRPSDCRLVISPDEALVPSTTSHFHRSTYPFRTSPFLHDAGSLSGPGDCSDFSVMYRARPPFPARPSADQGSFGLPGTGSDPPRIHQAKMQGSEVPGRWPQYFLAIQLLSIHEAVFRVAAVAMNFIA